MLSSWGATRDERARFDRPHLHCGIIQWSDIEFQTYTQKNKGVTLMTEEEKKKLAEEGKSDAEISQLEAIAELKEQMEGMVDQETYNKLKAEYDALMKDYIQKRPAPKKKEEAPLRPAKEIAGEFKNLGNGDITNRDYVEKALEYRNSHIKEFGTDPFTNFGEAGCDQPTADTKEVANVLQTLLDENESPIDFRIKLNSVLKDDPKLLSKLRKRVS